MEAFHINLMMEPRGKIRHFHQFLSWLLRYWNLGNSKPLWVFYNFWKTHFLHRPQNNNNIRVHTVCRKFMDISTSYGQKSKSAFKIYRDSGGSNFTKDGGKRVIVIQKMCSRCVFLLQCILQTLKVKGKRQRLAQPWAPSLLPSHTDEFTQRRQVSSSTGLTRLGHSLYQQGSLHASGCHATLWAVWNKCIHILMVSWQEFWRLYKMKKTWNTSYRTSILCTITYKIFKIQKFVILMKWYNSKTVLYIFYNCYTSTKARGILIYQCFCIIIYFWYYVRGHS